MIEGVDPKYAPYRHVEPPILKDCAQNAPFSLGWLALANEGTANVRSADLAPKAVGSLIKTQLEADGNGQAGAIIARSVREQTRLWEKETPCVAAIVASQSQRVNAEQPRRECLVCCVCNSLRQPWAAVLVARWRAVALPALGDGPRWVMRDDEASRLTSPRVEQASKNCRDMATTALVDQDRLRSR